MPITPGKYLAPGIGVVALVAVVYWMYYTEKGVLGTAPRVNPRDEVQVLRGRVIYDQHCAACHGQKLEGQPDWRSRRADGRLPAPPHDDAGHTWHHPDAVLIGIVKYGLVPPYAPKDYWSDMPAFGSVLGDEDIAATLAYIESKWSPEVWKVREEMFRQ